MFIILNIILYIDPGSGSLIFQALLSSLLTAIVFYKRIIAYIKFIFKKKSKDNPVDDNT